MVDRSQDEACFIIGAIGQPGSPVHADAEWVRTELIEPALAVANRRLGTDLWAYRSDTRYKFDDIWQAILHSILNDRLLFAILDDHRPNISYELGIALSAARPTIILKDRKFPHHFDVYHLHYVDYSISDDDDLKRMTVERLAQHVVDKYEAGFPNHAFAAAKIRPLNGREDYLHLYEKFVEISHEDWSKVISGARKSIDLAGKTLLELAAPRANRFVIQGSNNKPIHVSLKELLANQVLFSGVTVTIVMMHEDNPALEGMMEDTSAGIEPHDLSEVRRQLADSRRLWTEFAAALDAFDETSVGSYSFAALRAHAEKPLPKEKRGKIQIVQLRRGQLKFRMTLTESDVIATPIFYKLGINSSGPAIRANSSTNTYIVLRQELEYLKEINTETSTNRAVPQVGAAE